MSSEKLSQIRSIIRLPGKSTLARLASLLALCAVTRAGIATTKASSAKPARLQLTLLTGHGDAVSEVALSPDGRLLASVANIVNGLDESSDIILWDIKTRKQLRTFPLQDGLVGDIEFAADSRKLACSYKDGVDVWDCETGKLLATLTAKSFLHTHCAWSPNGKALIVGEEKRLVLWDMATQKQLRTLGLEGNADDVAFSPDGKKVAALDSGTSNGELLKLWDVQNGGLEWSTKIEASCESVCFTPDGKGVAVGTMLFPGSQVIPTVKIYKTSNGALDRQFSGHRGTLGSVVFSRDGKMFVSTSEETIRPPSGDDTYYAEAIFRDAKTFKVIRKVREKTAWANLKLSRDGQTAYVPHWDGTVKVWQWRKQKWDQWQQIGFPQTGESVVSLDVSPDNKTIASLNCALIDQPATVRLWDFRNGRLVRSIKAHQRNGHAVAFALGRNRVVSSGSAIYNRATRETVKQDIRLWNVDTAKPLRTITDFSSGWFDGSFSVSSDGKVLAAPTRDGKRVVFWQLSSGKPLRSFQVRSPWVVRLAANGKVLVTSNDGIGGEDAEGQVRIWNVKTGSLKKLINFDQQVTALAISPDGSTLAAANAVFNAYTGKKIGDLPVRHRTLGDEAYAFSPNSRWLAYADGGSIRLWNRQNKQVVFSLPSDTSVSVLSFARDGNTIVSNGYDGSKIWSLRRHRLLATLRILPPAKVETVSQSWIAYTPSGFYTASPDCERFIRWKAGEKLYPADRF